MTYANFLTVIMITPLLLVWAIAPNDAVAVLADWLFRTISKLLLDLPFSRNMETEADIVGLEISSKACFDIREAPAFWGKMELLAGLEGDGSDIEFLSTHPSHANRQNHLLEILPQALNSRSTCGCSKLNTPDPMAEFLKFKVFYLTFY